MLALAKNLIECRSNRCAAEVFQGLDAVRDYVSNFLAHIVCHDANVAVCLVQLLLDILTDIFDALNQIGDT